MNFSSLAKTKRDGQGDGIAWLAKHPHYTQNPFLAGYRHSSEIGRFQIDCGLLGVLLTAGVGRESGGFTSLGLLGADPNIRRSSTFSQACNSGF